MTPSQNSRARAARTVRPLMMLLLGGLMLATAAPGVALAAVAPQLQLDTAAQSQISRIEDKLDTIRTLRAGFLQSSSNGQSAQGELYLSRPGKMRIEYKPPVPILVVADGRFLIYYDRSLEQVSYVPIGSTPAGILLEKHVGLLGKDVLITDYQRVNGTVELSVVRADHPGEGSITLIFDEATLALVQWRIEDAQGITTLVTLIDPRVNVQLPDTLFVFTDPRPIERTSP